MRTAHKAACLIAVLCLVGATFGGNPGDAVMAAAADLAKVPEAARPFVRYLSAYHLGTPEACKEHGQALSFWCNSLSREPDIERPVQVRPDLWRVDLRWYGWDRKVWERLAVVDPYFHVLGRDAVELVEVEKEVIQQVEYGHYERDGNRVPHKPGEVPAGARWVVVELRPEKKIVKVLEPKVALKGVPQPAPWLPVKEYGYLASQTQSNLPIIRSDQFIFETGVQKDRVAGYYDFLGLGKDEKDFQELIGADVKLAQKVRKEIAATVARSGVTLNNRSMERFATLTGAYWRTQDFKSSTFKQNTLRLLDGETEPPRGDASEQYGSLPNELFAFWLQNDKAVGGRQDAAPDFIASDGHAAGTDRRVHVGISCVRCHTPGIQPINDWIRAVYRQESGVALGSPDYDKYRRLKQLYLSDLDGHIRGDQQRYAAALIKCNGLTPQANAAVLAGVWSTYADEDLDAAGMAAEIGCTEQKLLAALKAKGPTGVDPVLAGLLARPPVKVRREHWVESYSIMQGYLGGAK